MAQPPKKGGSGRVFLILGIIAAVLIVGCIGACVALGIGARILGTAASTKVSELATQAGTELAGASSLTTVEEFCTSESSQDYASAYSSLSPSLQQQFSQSKFTDDNQNYDNTLGTISTCSPQGLPTVNGSTATISVTVTRTLIPTPDNSGNSAPTQTANQSGQITMEEDSSGTWVISNIDPSLDML